MGSIWHDLCGFTSECVREGRWVVGICGFAFCVRSVVAGWMKTGKGTKLKKKEVAGGVGAERVEKAAHCRPF